MRKRHFYWMMATIISGILSCTPIDSNTIGDSNDISSGERIDIHITDHIDLSYHLLIDEQDESTIDQIIPAFPAYEYSFVLRLPDDRELKLTLINKHLANSWNYPGIPFDIFPTSVLNQKYKYVQAELIGKTADAQYESHAGNTAPMDISLDVFHIVQLHESRLLARITNLTLYQSQDPENRIVINGTFVSDVPKFLY